MFRIRASLRWLSSATVVCSACQGTLWLEPLPDAEGESTETGSEVADDDAASATEGESSAATSDDANASCGASSSSEASSADTQSTGDGDGDGDGPPAVQVELSCAEDPSRGIALDGIPYVFHVGSDVIEEGTLEDGVARCEACSSIFSLTFTIDPEGTPRNVTLHELTGSSALRYELCARTDLDPELLPYGSALVTVPGEDLGPGVSYELMGGRGAPIAVDPGSTHELEVGWDTGGLSSTGEVPVLAVARESTPPYDVYELAFDSVPHLPTVTSELTLSGWTLSPEDLAHNISNNTSIELTVNSVQVGRQHHGVSFFLAPPIELAFPLTTAPPASTVLTTHWPVLPLELSTANHFRVDLTTGTSGERIIGERIAELWNEYTYVSEFNHHWYYLTPPTTSQPGFSWLLDANFFNEHVFLEACDDLGRCWTAIARGSENEVDLPPTSSTGLADIDPDQFSQVWGRVASRSWHTWSDDMAEGFRLANFRDVGRVDPPPYLTYWVDWTLTWSSEP